MLELKKIEDCNLYRIINLVSEDNLLLKTFGNGKNIKSRLLNSCYACFICLNGVRIGFINVVDKNNMYEVDMGILSMYRNKGYGTMALRMLRESILCYCRNVIIQTERNNVAANKSIIDNEFRLIKKDEKYNYYSM